MQSFKKLLEKLIPKKIWQQVGLAFALIIAVSLFLLGYSLINTSRKAVVDSVRRDNREIAGATAREISSFVDRPKRLLVTMATILSTISVNDIDAQKVILYQLIVDNPTLFERVVITDANGLELLSSDLPAPAGMKDYGQNPVFQELLAKKEPATSKAYFSNENFPYIIIAAPINKLGKMERALLAEVKLSLIWSIVANVQIKGASIFVVDEEGYALMHTEEKKVYRKERLIDSEAVRRGLQGEEGSIEENSPNRETQERWLSAFAPIAPLGWVLVISQPLTSAYAFSFTMSETAVIFIALAVGISILFSLLIARWIVSPIRKLTEMIGRVEAGDLDQEIKVERSDEIGKLITAFNKMTKGLKRAKRLEKLSAIGVATSKITHELRNPLVAVKTFVQLLPRRYRDENFIAQFNENVPSEMLRLERMLGTLSEFSKIQQLYPGDYDVVALIKSSLELLKMQADQQKISLSTEFESEKIVLFIDGDKIKQVLINLIRNAFDAMLQGGSLSVAVSLERNTANYTRQYSDKSELPAYKVSVSHNGTDREWLAIRITDTGHGMSKETLANVFEPFMTTKRSGLGLGLTICKEIVEEHRGLLEVESEKDKGTTFTIRLPRLGIPTGAHQGGQAGTRS